MNDLKDRTKKFALDVISLCAQFPKSLEFHIITRHLMHSAASVAENYQSACRGKSKADFISKLSTVEVEADESLVWLEMLADLCHKRIPELKRLQDEAGQLVTIMVSSKKTARNGGKD